MFNSIAETLKNDDIQEYYEIVRNPVDFQTIKQRLSSNQYHEL